MLGGIALGVIYAGSPGELARRTSGSPGSTSAA